MPNYLKLYTPQDSAVVFIDHQPVLLLRVHVVVLGGGDDGVTLDALDVASRHLPRQHGILPKRLEQAAEYWDADDV